MGKVGGWIVWPVEDPSGPAGRRARTARTKHGRGPLAPAHALVLRAPWARKTPPPPGVTQRLPPPLRQRASASHTAVARGRRKEGADMRGGAAAFGGQGAALRAAPLSLSKNLWRMEDRGPFRLSSDLATQGELSRRDKRRPPGGCASNPQKALRSKGFPA